MTPLEGALFAIGARRAPDLVPLGIAAHGMQDEAPDDPRPVNQFPRRGGGIGTSRAAVELGHREFAMAEGFRGGQPAVRGTHDHVDQRVAGLRDRHLAPEDS